jgi:predicted  nucleic acid-binding Zn-ribbon protein
MRRRQQQIDRLTEERDTARERAGDARAEAAELRGRAAGEKAGARVVAEQLAMHAADLGGQLATARANGQRAAQDANALRRLAAEHLDALQQGLDPATAASLLIERLRGVGISLQADLYRAAAATRQTSVARAAESAAATTSGEPS